MTIASITFKCLANAGYFAAHYAAGKVIFAEGDKGDARLSLSAVVTSWKRSELAAFSARWP